MIFKAMFRQKSVAQEQPPPSQQRDNQAEEPPKVRDLTHDEEEWKEILNNVERQLADLDATSTSCDSNIEELLSTAAFWEQRRDGGNEKLSRDSAKRSTKKQRNSSRVPVKKPELEREITEECTDISEAGEKNLPDLSAILAMTNLDEEDPPVIDVENQSVITFSTTTTLTAIPTLITCQETHPVQNEDLLGDPIDLIKYSNQRKVSSSSTSNMSGMDKELHTHVRAFDTLLDAHLDAIKAEKRSLSRSRKLSAPTTMDNLLENQEKALADFIQEYPLVLQVQYRFPQLETSCYPLHYFCATSCLTACQMSHFYFAEAIGMADSGGDLPLHYASYMHASVDVLRFLVKEYPRACRQTNDLQQTPLHSIVLLGCPSPDAVRVLVEAHEPACLLVDEDGNTPMHLLLSHAGESNTVETASVLAKASKESFLQPNHNGDTPLHIACRFGLERSVVSWLIRESMEATYRANQQGLSPLDLAIEKEHWHLVESLTRADGDCLRASPRVYEEALEKGAPDHVVKLLR